MGKTEPSQSQSIVGNREIRRQCCLPMTEDWTASDPHKVRVLVSRPYSTPYGSCCHGKPLHSRSLSANGKAGGKPASGTSALAGSPEYCNGLELDFRGVWAAKLLRNRRLPGLENYFRVARNPLAIDGAFPMMLPTYRQANLLARFRRLTSTR